MIKRLLFIFSFFLFTSLLAEPKVTHGGAAGRLGDHLIAYLHAKWIAYHYGMPYVYKPFLYSDAFVLHLTEKPYNSKENTVKVKDLTLLDHPENKVYEILYSPESLGEYPNEAQFRNGCPYIAVDWNDKAFLDWVQPCLAPRTPIKTIPLPVDKVSVALHIRRPCGVDASPKIHQVFPYKFLPEQFYIDQLKWLYEEMGRRPMYVYIFSNDPNAKKLAAGFEAALKNPHIIFDYPKTPGESKEAVLKDFYSMMNFDCMIRADSNLSIVASKLGRQKIVISPEHITVNSNKNVVDRVRIERR